MQTFLLFKIMPRKKPTGSYAVFKEELNKIILFLKP